MGVDLKIGILPVYLRKSVSKKVQQFAVCHNILNFDRDRELFNHFLFWLGNEVCPKTALKDFIANDVDIPLYSYGDSRHLTVHNQQLTDKYGVPLYAVHASDFMATWLAYKPSGDKHDMSKWNTCLQHYITDLAANNDAYIVFFWS